MKSGPNLFGSGLRLLPAIAAGTRASSSSDPRVGFRLVALLFMLVVTFRVTRSWQCGSPPPSGVDGRMWAADRTLQGSQSQYVEITNCIVSRASEHLFECTHFRNSRYKPLALQGLEVFVDRTRWVLQPCAHGAGRSNHSARTQVDQMTHKDVRMLSLKIVRLQYVSIALTT